MEKIIMNCDNYEKQYNHLIEYNNSSSTNKSVCKDNEESIFETGISTFDVLKNESSDAQNQVKSLFENTAQEKYLLTDNNNNSYTLFKIENDDESAQIIKNNQTDEIVAAKDTTYYANGQKRTEETAHINEIGETNYQAVSYDEKGNLLYKEISVNDSSGNEKSLADFYNEKGEKTCHSVEKNNKKLSINYVDNEEYSRDYYETSDRYGILNHTISYDNGKTISVSSGSEEQNGVEINKNFTSADGTKTHYAYNEDQSNGSYSLVYQIQDKNGEMLLDTKRSYQKISDNEAISKLNDNVYRIITNGEQIRIIDETKKESFNLDLSTLVIDNEENLVQEEGWETTSENQKIKDIIKSQPGDVLIDIAKETDKIGQLNIENGCYLYDNETILAQPRSSTLVHELGHAIDTIPGFFGAKNLSKDKDFLKIFNEEKKNFESQNLSDQQKSSEYLMNPTEFSAEAKMLTTTIQAASKSERAHTLQLYFPKSIAYINSQFSDIDNITSKRKTS